MSECSKIDALVTPYVDRALDAGERAAVDLHLSACPPCRRRVESEAAVRELMGARREALCGERAPDLLRARCATLSAVTPAPPRAVLLARYALAASIVLAVGALALQQVTRASTRVLAAELAADHVKCFLVNAVLGTHHEPAAAERFLEARFNWDLDLPAGADPSDLDLVGARTCLYGDGTVAHLMYEHHGEPVSVFMLPATAREAEIVGALGHEAAIWSSGDRTFVLLARESREEVEALAMQARTVFR
jgi:anti-sigma factor RsiW